MNTTHKITTPLIILLLIAVGWMVFLGLKSNKVTSPVATIPTHDIGALLGSNTQTSKPGGANAIADLLRKKAISGNVISINNCVPTPVALKVNFEGNMTFVNTGNTDTTILIGKDDTLRIAKMSSTTIPISRILPESKDFTHQLVAKTYGCEGAAGPVGIVKFVGIIVSGN